jgi:hypothetical protein
MHALAIPLVTIPQNREPAQGVDSKVWGLATLLRSCSGVAGQGVIWGGGVLTSKCKWCISVAITIQTLRQFAPSTCQVQRTAVQRIRTS